jgi:ABC-2 type transport system ATP-binding protein
MPEDSAVSEADGLDIEVPAPPSDISAAPASAPIVETTELTKQYGPVTALDGVSLCVPRGGVHCLVGPNGSGKTTLFDILLGLTRPTSGSVMVRTDRVGYGFQQPTVYPDLSVGENLDVFASITGAPTQAWRDTVAETFGLDQVRHRVAWALSGGWQQKLDLALAFLGAPSLVILDEPMGDLDDAARAHLRRFLQAYVAAGHTVLVSSHRVSAFEGVADRLTVLERGAVVHDGAVADLEEPLEAAYLQTLTE